MTLRVLFVDDDSTYWEIVQEAISSEARLADSSFVRLCDGSEAIAYLSRAAPYEDKLVYPWPDVVIIDQRMLRVDGTEVLAKLRAAGLGQTLSICLMTSSEQPKLVTEALARGARFCFTKPLEFDNIVEALARIVSFFQEVAVLPPNPTGER